jgi:flagellar biosynthetic protein FlhB
MATDERPADNRTEDPTPRRRQQARDEGRIARSPELVAAALLVTGTILLASVGGRAIGRQAIELFRVGPGWLLDGEPTLAGMVALIRAVTWRSAVALAPLLIGLGLVALALGAVQAQGIASWKPVRPDLARINPLKGFRRIFGAEAVLNLIKASGKLAVLATVTYVVLRQAIPRFASLADGGPAMVILLLEWSIVRVGVSVGLAFLALGALDYAVQRFRLEKSLKMSRQEIVQEHREQEGDPQIKARIRQIARQRARKQMLSQVAKADVVITNPTHLAVALRYDGASGGAPTVVAMGERKLAERIKAIALRAGVPLVENKPLARALLATCTVGSPIPPALYVAVAEILAFVYRRRGRIPAAVGSAALGRAR